MHLELKGFSKFAFNRFSLEDYESQDYMTAFYGRLRKFLKFYI